MWYCTQTKRPPHDVKAVDSITENNEETKDDDDDVYAAIGDLMHDVSN